MSTADLSVVVPVHAGADPDHVRAALASLAAQSVTPRRVVVVVDGPVSEDHERAIATSPQAEVVRLPECVGSGLARRRAIQSCTTTWIALADSDDISEPTRFERQLSVLEASGADVCTTAMREFDSAGVAGVRATPVHHAEFARLMGSRNPVNQPAAVFRLAAYERAGGYHHLPYLEDYDLWARMLASGARFVGAPEPLVRFRTDGMLGRRTTPEARRSEREIQRRLRLYGLIGPGRELRNRCVRGLYLRLPQPLLRLAYRSVFHRRTELGLSQ